MPQDIGGLNFPHYSGISISDKKETVTQEPPL